MTLLRLLDPTHAPRDGFEFKDPATPDSKFTAHGKTLDYLFKAAREYRTANGIAIPDDFDLQIEHAVCRLLPPERSVNRDGTPRNNTCIHRGGEVDRIVCEPCGGRIQAIILGCAIHGRCSLFLRDVGVMRCALCSDCVPKETLTPLTQ